MEPDTKILSCSVRWHWRPFALFGWIALTILHIGANLYLLNFRIDIEDNLLARKHITQVRVLLRALDTVIVLVHARLCADDVRAVRQYGVSLFASAGAAGVIFGLAAQPVLSNLIAGIQLAVTQPIRLEDAVTVQNEYGWIEEINATYVVIRLWDLRRLIVPLNFFIQQPFYNWTRQAAANMGYGVALSRLHCPGRSHPQKAKEFVAQSAQWSGKVVNVQVTNTSAAADRSARSLERRQCRPIPLTCVPRCARSSSVFCSANTQMRCRDAAMKSSSSRHARTGHDPNQPSQAMRDAPIGESWADVVTKLSPTTAPA